MNVLYVPVIFTFFTLSQVALGDGSAARCSTVSIPSQTRFMSSRFETSAFTISPKRWIDSESSPSRTMRRRLYLRCDCSAKYEPMLPAAPVTRTLRRTVFPSASGRSGSAENECAMTLPRAKDVPLPTWHDAHGLETRATRRGCNNRITVLPATSQFNRDLYSQNELSARCSYAARSRMSDSI